HLGRGRPGREVAGHHRPGPAVGAGGQLHLVRQVRPGLSDGGDLPAGLDRGRDAAPPRTAGVPGDRPGEEALGRVRLATVWLGGCSGCHMSFLDLDEFLIDLAGMVDLVYSPLVDVKEFPRRVDVTLVEGAVANEENLEMIHRVRQRTRVLVSFGDCAVTGNV